MGVSLVGFMTVFGFRFCAYCSWGEGGGLVIIFGELTVSLASEVFFVNLYPRFFF